MTLIYYFFALAAFIISVCMHHAALEQEEESLEHTSWFFLAIGIMLLTVFTFLAIFRG